jgi:sugar lactone lactonase YvrE
LDGQVTTFAGNGENGWSNGELAHTRFDNPQALAFAPDGSLFVADSGNNAIRRVATSGASTAFDGIGWPTAIAVDSDGTLFVESSSEGRLYSVKDGKATIVANVAGTLGDLDGPAASARLRPAGGIGVTPDRVFFSDAANYAVRSLDRGTSTISRVAGTGHFGTALGDGTTAELVLPRGLALAGKRIIVSDSGNHRIVAIDP